MDQRRATCWSVTINMKNTKRETAEEWIHCARSKGWKVHGQIEQAPTTGTLHYQLMLETPQTRFSGIKKAFPTAHIEICRNKRALSQYVEKEDTRVAELVQQNDKYPSIAKFWSLIYQFYDRDDGSGWDRTHSEVCFHNLDQQLLLEKDPLGFLDRVTDELIRQGYVVDQIITNPAVRSFWKKFHAAILYRTRETDRQTDTIVVPTIDNTNAAQDNQSDGQEERTSESGSECPSTDYGTSDEGSGDTASQATDCTSDGEQGGWL